MGNTLNFGPEIQQYESVLRPFAFSLTKSREATEDLIQDTFYRALSNSEKFLEGSNIKAWLFTIMRNLFINDYRKRQKAGLVTYASDNLYLLDNTKRIEKNESERSFLAEDISKAMKGVNSDFTEPFLMYFNGFSYLEIADKLDLPLGTVKSRIFFARKELQTKLKGMGVLSSVYN